MLATTAVAITIPTTLIMRSMATMLTIRMLHVNRNQAASGDDHAGNVQTAHDARDVSRTLHTQNASATHLHS